MTCAMHLHDPCDGGEVLRHLIPLLVGRRGEKRIPMCWRHVDAWDQCLGPFKTFSEMEREKWARWAAKRAKRQGSVA